LHTSFRLSSAGERLALLNAQGVVQDEYAPTYPPQRADVSYGHAEGAPNRNGYFVAPTPGAPNGAKGDGFAPEVEFSVSSGTYSGALEVQLSPSTNAPVPVRTVIRYTVDGSIPTETSLVYSTPLRFTNLAVRLRARAFTGGLLPGELRGVAVDRHDETQTAADLDLGEDDELALCIADARGALAFGVVAGVDGVLRHLDLCAIGLDGPGLDGFNLLSVCAVVDVHDALGIDTGSSLDAHGPILGEAVAAVGGDHDALVISLVSK
jgi:hypothetical protein